MELKFNSNLAPSHRFLAPKIQIFHFSFRQIVRICAAFDESKLDDVTVVLLPATGLGFRRIRTVRKRPRIVAVVPVVEPQAATTRRAEAGPQVVAGQTAAD
jgi:hypothetical protein